MANNLNKVLEQMKKGKSPKSKVEEEVEEEEVEETAEEEDLDDELEEEEEEEEKPVAKKVKKQLPPMPKPKTTEQEQENRLQQEVDLLQNDGIFRHQLLSYLSVIVNKLTDDGGSGNE